MLFCINLPQHTEELSTSLQDNKINWLLSVEKVPENSSLNYCSLTCIQWSPLQDFLEFSQPPECLDEAM